ncbi:MAG: hypothetical protein ABI797_06565 [Chloroflexota bacterium]
MELGLLEVVAALGGLFGASDVVASLVCTAAENLPCRPLTLECLFAGVGGLSAGLPAVPPGWGGFPTPEPPRQYAPSPPPGYQPPPPQSPQDALNDVQRLKDDYAVDKDRAGRAAGVGLPTGAPSTGMSAADVLIQSIRNSNRR